MSLFKLLFKFNPSKLKVVPAERMSMQMRDQISEFLDDISKRITKGDYDVTPGQLEYLKNQGDEVARMNQMLAERAARNKQGVGSFMKQRQPKRQPADIIQFGKAPKTDLKKVRDRKAKVDQYEKEMAENNQFPVKDVDDDLDGFAYGGLATMFMDR